MLDDWQCRTRIWRFKLRQGLACSSVCSGVFQSPHSKLVLTVANRSKMGILESGGIYLHPVCWHPQEPGSAHIQSEVSQPGPMDNRTNPGTVFLLDLFSCRSYWAGLQGIAPGPREGKGMKVSLPLWADLLTSKTSEESQHECKEMQNKNLKVNNDCTTPRLYTNTATLIKLAEGVYMSVLSGPVSHTGILNSCFFD